MTYSSQFEQYIRAFSNRLKRLIVARGAAVIAVTALVVTLVAVAAAIRAGFPDNFMIGARLILAMSVGALAWYFIVYLRGRIDSHAAAEIEERTPPFAGRVEAYVDTRDEKNPMRELLAEETLQIAADHAPEKQVAAREFRLAWSVAGIATAVLLLVAIAGPGNYAYGVRDLWVGWALPGLLPPQSIDVSPGDDGIRMGGTVKVRATMQGFDPVDAWVHASFGDGDWQQVPMSQVENAFEFTFFSVRKRLEYYVSASNVRSPTYQVHVVDLPNVENLALTYSYPGWTEREPEIHDPGGDIRAIAETEIELRITTDRPMTPGAVIIDDEHIALDVAGTTATAVFRLEHDGQYFVAAMVGGERIRLTDDYFIKILDDEAPEVAFTRPGRDWSASRIEEVTTRVTAEDDFRIDSLELHYSVNGGEWASVDLEATGGAVEVDHVFFLESLAEDGQEPLSPGDLISYYAVAEDRESSARTDMFFIDVQPFDRRYSQSQQAGGGPQGGPQDEVSQRQREIIISTWNLIRERAENGRGKDAFVSDNAALLSRLQETLRGQVETLAQRAEARQLTASDEEIAAFVEHLRKAAEAMTPAAQLLAEIDLDQALLPEQEALQHLLAAEAVFTDINVSMQANRGGGGQAGRDLSEMFELEMDLEKNQYETGSRATPDKPQEQMQEAADELAELARRQEQLARNRNRSQPTPEQRWQQEMLRREVEELQRRLEQMRAGQQQSQSSQSESSQGDSGERSSSRAANGESTEREIDELQRRLSSALRAMNEADEAMRNGGDPESLRRAMDEAQRQLQGATDSATEASQRAMQAAVEDLVERADELHDAQAGLERQLQEAVREAMQDPNGALDSGLSWQEELEIASEKRELLAGLQQLQRDAKGTAQTLDEEQPRAADEIREGVNRLQDFEVEARIAVAAAYIEQGEAVYVASSESAVTEALRQLREDLRRAQGMIEAGAEGGPGSEDQMREALAEARALRRALQQAAEGDADGTGFRAGGPEDTDRGTSTGVRVDDLDAIAIERQAQVVSQGVMEALRALSNAGANARDIDELRQLAAGIRASDFSGNPDILAREARLALALAEQLELQLSRTIEGNADGIRGTSAEEIPEQHREIIADYYRRLGSADANE
ncbi:MAG: hypothetical protein GTO71_08505 [Woeseiaceae bacterium]|nr:hypothetical protein [Woeseiaceae bacterium]NIP21126.1 hypothetical protein [Woeseiaceae bacterium]NIS90098.1 hypothetical protein [Woeseiaceae bacterium]